MEKTEVMKRYEEETGKQSAIVRFMAGGQALEQKSYPKLGSYDYSMDYIAWLEAKAESYDRIIKVLKKRWEEYEYLLDQYEEERMIAEHEHGMNMYDANGMP